jgi:hypothetical protein
MPGWKGWRRYRQRAPAQVPEGDSAAAAIRFFNLLLDARPPFHPSLKKPKQVFLGDQSSGKTSIISRFMYDKFDNTVRCCVWWSCVIGDCSCVIDSSQ